MDRVPKLVFETDAKGCINTGTISETLLTLLFYISVESIGHNIGTILLCKYLNLQIKL